MLRIALEHNKYDNIVSAMGIDLTFKMVVPSNKQRAVTASGQDRAYKGHTITKISYLDGRN